MIRHVSQHPHSNGHKYLYIMPEKLNKIILVFDEIYNSTKRTDKENLWFTDKQKQLQKIIVTKFIRYAFKKSCVIYTNEAK